MLGVLFVLVAATEAFYVDVLAGKKECFTQNLKRGDHIAIYYQGLAARLTRSH